MFYEIKKIKSNKIYKIGIVILFIIIAISCYSSYRSYSYIESIDSEKMYKGIEAINKTKDSYSKISGELTTDKLNNALNIYNKNGNNYASEFLSGAKYPRVIQLLQDAYGEYDNPSEKLSTVKNANNFYSRRGMVLSSYLKNNNVDEKEITKIKDRIDKIKTPFRYDFADQWINMWKSFYVVYLYLIIFSLILTSSIFSVEMSTGMDSILVNLKDKMKRKISKNKIRGVYYIITKFYLISFIIITALMIGMAGMNGWNCPVQIRYLFSIYNLTFLGGTIFYFFLGLLSLIAISSISCIVYLVLNRSVISIIASIVLIFSPLVLKNISKTGLVGKFMSIFPVNGIDMMSILQYPRLYNIGGVYISNMIMILIVSIIIILLTYIILPKLFNYSLRKTVS